MAKAEQIKVEYFEDIVDYMKKNQQYFNNLICELVLQALESGDEDVTIVEIEVENTMFHDGTNTTTLKVEGKNFITALKTNLPGVVELENYELAARVRDKIKEYEKI